jgi:hypothetical protein
VIERDMIMESLHFMRTVSGHPKGWQLPDRGIYAVLPVFLPPSVVAGWDASHNETFRLHVINGTIEGNHGSNLKYVPTTFQVSWQRYARLIAKIAHGYCVRKYGVDGIEPFLLDIILGRTGDDREIWRFVGGTESPVTAQQEHFVSVQPLRIHGKTLISVHVQLFTSKGTPIYWVIAGRLPG